MSNHLRSFPRDIVAAFRNETVRDAIAFAAVAFFILVFSFWSAIAADQITQGRIQ